MIQKQYRKVKVNKYFYKGLLNLFFRNGLIYAMQKSQTHLDMGIIFTQTHEENRLGTYSWKL